MSTEVSPLLVPALRAPRPRLAARPRDLRSLRIDMGRRGTPSPQNPTIRGREELMKELTLRQMDKHWTGPAHRYGLESACKSGATTGGRDS